MKKLILTFLSVFVLVSVSFAQTFTFALNGNDGTLGFVQAWQLVEFHGDVTNLTNAPITIRFNRAYENYPPNGFWSSSICVGSNCFAPWIGDTTFVVDANSTQDIRLNVTPGTVQGQAKIIVEYSNLNNPTEKFVQDYYVSTAEVTGIKNETKILPTFKLSQNYPNPFNPTTQISLSVEKNGFGQLNVFNVLGQKIQTLASQKFVAGKDYTFEWNGKDFNGKSVSTG
ncbi:hypothetical protein IT568_09390, partial [bacterium]|nr:hypothetical protein [bacterium]